MPPKTLAKAGAVLLATGALLWWGAEGWLYPRFSDLWDSHYWPLVSEYQELLAMLEYLCLCFAGAGLMLVLRAIWQWLQARMVNGEALRMLPAIQLRNVVALRRHKPMPVMSGLAGVGSGWFCVVSLLLLAFQSFSYAPQGLRIELENTHLHMWAESPGIETLGVYLDGKGNYYVNGERVEESKLREKLGEELGRRVVWTVYLEADPSSLFAGTVRAMDTIQGLGAKVIWITPKMREEWKKSQEGEMPQNSRAGPE